MTIVFAASPTRFGAMEGCHHTHHPQELQRTKPTTNMITAASMLNESLHTQPDLTDTPVATPSRRSRTPRRGSAGLGAVLRSRSKSRSRKNTPQKRRGEEHITTGGDEQQAKPKPRDRKVLRMRVKSRGSQQMNQDAALRLLQEELYKKKGPRRKSGSAFMPADQYWAKKAPRRKSGSASSSMPMDEWTSRFVEVMENRMHRSSNENSNVL